MESATDQDFKTIVPHDLYYISGGDLYFQVDDVSFRVHKYFFERDSSFFADLLNTPPPPGIKPLGSTDATAIGLRGVDPEQFAKLLWVFYNPLYSIYEAPYSTWADILHMAYTWGFHGVKELAIRELENKTLPDVDRIRLYLDNGVDGNLLVPCYTALCVRENPLTLDEGRMLGIEVTIQIAAGREQVRATIGADGQRSPPTPTVSGKALRDFIREFFQISQRPASPAFNDEEDPVNTTPAAGTGNSTPSQGGDADPASGQAETGGDAFDAATDKNTEGAGLNPNAAARDGAGFQAQGKQRKNKRGAK